MAGDFEMEEFAGFSDFAGEARLGKKRVVGRLDHEGGNLNGCKVWLAAGAGPVVAGILKSILGRGEAVVKFGEGFDLLDAIKIQFSREFIVLLDDFFFQAIHEAGHVDSVVPVSKSQGA